jgi:hypothetical protein
VDSRVIAQVGLLRESLLAVAAHIFLVGRVIAYVIQQRGLAIEDLLAQWALSLFAQQNFTLKRQRKSSSFHSQREERENQILTSMFIRACSISSVVAADMGCVWVE